jgi:hypothetical protein
MWRQAWLVGLTVCVGNAGCGDASNTPNTTGGASFAGSAGAGGAGGGAGGVPVSATAGLGHDFFTPGGGPGVGSGGSGGAGYCQGYVVLRTDSDLLDFANRQCETLDGSLSVVDYPITSLDRLAPSSLRTITGSLSVAMASGLKNLKGLAGLRRIGGSLSVGSNSALENLDGLESLESIGTDPLADGLFVQDNRELTNIDALQHARITGKVSIMASEKVTSLAGLAGVTQSGELFITGVPELKELRLDALAECADCKISTLPKLQRLELPSLKRAQVLLISSHLRLTSISLPVLETVERSFSVIVNDALTSVGTLDTLSSVGMLQFAENPKLSQCFVDALGARLNACQSRCGGNDKMGVCP